MLAETSGAGAPFPHCGAAHGASGGPRAGPEPNRRVAGPSDLSRSHRAGHIASREVRLSSVVHMTRDSTRGPWGACLFVLLVCRRFHTTHHRPLYAMTHLAGRAARWRNDNQTSESSLTRRQPRLIMPTCRGRNGALFPHIAERARTTYKLYLFKFGTRRFAPHHAPPEVQPVWLPVGRGLRAVLCLSQHCRCCQPHAALSPHHTQVLQD